LPLLSFVLLSSLLITSLNMLHKSDMANSTGCVYGSFANFVLFGTSLISQTKANRPDKSHMLRYCKSTRALLFILPPGSNCSGTVFKQSSIRPVFLGCLEERSFHVMDLAPSVFQWHTRLKGFFCCLHGLEDCCSAWFR
jgi:hypothetical protein